MQQDWHLMKYSHHKTKYIGKQVGLRTYQHPYILENKTFARFEVLKAVLRNVHVIPSCCVGNSS